MRGGGTVLALDLATAYGWALGAPGSVPKTGHGRFGVPGMSEGAIGFAALAWANEFLRMAKPTVLCIEEPQLFQSSSRPTNKAVLKRLWGLSSIVAAVAYGRGCYDVRVVHADPVRKHFIGTAKHKGDKAKRLVQAQCRHLGWPFATPDEADALALWSWACDDLAPGTGFALAPVLDVGPRLARIPQVRMTAREAAQELFSKRRKP